MGLNTPENVDVEVEEEEQTREELLEPVIERLNLQASSGNPAPIVSVTGAVRLPGEYPLIGGGSIGEQVRLAGGFLDGAYLRKAEVRRIDINQADGATIGVFEVDLKSGNGNDFALRARDSIRINLVPNYSTSEVVELSGEIVFPGSYTISKSETLGSLIARAGIYRSGLPRWCQIYLEGSQRVAEITARENFV